jgi:hypothetical protein
MESEKAITPKFLFGKIKNKYLILKIIMRYSFYIKKSFAFNLLFRTSRSFRQLLLENDKVATRYSEEPLNRIQCLPFTISQIDLTIPIFYEASSLFVLINGDRVYTA